MGEIVRMRTVSFTADRLPMPRKIRLGIEGDNLVERLRFALQVIAEHQTATLVITGRADVATLKHDEENGYYIDLTREIVGTDGETEAYVVIDGAGGESWRSDVMRLITGALPDVDEEIQQRYPGAVETMLGRIAEHNAEMDEQTERVEDAAKRAEDAAERAEDAAERADAGGGSGGGPGVAVDKTLTVDGAAADAKATGDAIGLLSEKKADQIIASRSGSVIVIPDASPVKFKGLTIPENSEDYRIRLYGKNLFDMDTVLPSLSDPGFPGFQWTKEADGSYSLSNLGVFYNKTWWENTSGYNGQMSISFEARQIETNVNVQTLSVQFVYTDGTKSSVVCDCTSDFRRYTATSVAGKAVADIRQSYNANKKTYIKNIIINYGNVMEYEPFAGERSVIVSSADVSAFTASEALAGYNTIVSDDNTDMSVAYALDVAMYVDRALAEYKAQNTPNKLDYLTSRKPGIKLYGDTSTMTKDNAVDMVWKLPYEQTQGGCSVKWQGSSSVGFPKKNYTVKFDRFPHEQYYGEYMPGWAREKKFCFKANYIDSSHLRNILSAKLWGKVVKSRSVPNERLNVLPNGGAIDGFPFVLFINDEFEGLYTWNIPKDGWMMGMGNGTHECIVCAEGVDEHLSCVFKDTEKAFGQGFSLEYITDENDTGWALTSLNNLITAVINDDTATVGNLLDLDSAIDYFIFTLLIGHIDGMSKNYLLSTYDGTKWFFTAYDMDSTFGLYPDGSRFLSASMSPPC